MKKKCLIAVFFTLICFAFLNFGAISNTSYATDEEVEIVFQISNSNNKIAVTSENLNGQYNSWANAMQAVGSNLGDADVICFNFNNFNFSQANILYMDFSLSKNVVCTGTVTSINNGSVFNLTSNQNLTFRNLIVNVEKANKIVSFSGTNNILNFAEDVTYTGCADDTKIYFTEYSSENSIFAVNPTTNLKVFVSSFELDNELVVGCENSYSNFVKLYYPESEDYYNTSTFVYYEDEPWISVSSYTVFKFKLNGGTYSNLTMPYEYNYSASAYEIVYPYGTSTTGLINFENQGTPSRSHATYDGLYGYLKVGTQEYYFDIEMLQNYVENGENFANIDSYFAKSLKNVKNSQSIKNYSSYNKDSYSNYKHFEFFKKNNLSPTYIAKWIVEEYKIEFVTDTDQSLSALTLEYGQKIPEFSEITKDGFTFDGWYTNQNRTTKFELTSMPANNITLYAKWTPKKFTLSFNTNGGTEIKSVEYDFGEQTVRPVNPEKEGYDFENWYEDELLTIVFEFGTMPKENTTIYANWTIKVFNIYFHSSVSNTTRIIQGIEYNSDIPELIYPEFGYTLMGLYTSKNYDTLFDLTQKVKSNLYIYAKFTINTYTITLKDNYTENNDEYISANYGEKITLPTLTREHYIFGGWYFDNGTFSNLCTTENMPAENFNLYAKWTMKEAITLELKPQSFQYTTGGVIYRNETGYSNVKIYYLVNNEWITDAPLEVGSYNIRAVREEDETYLAADAILENGFTILQKETSIIWIIALLYIATIFEIVVSIVVRIMLKRKLSATFVMIGNILVSTSQFVNLIISGLMCLAGFVYMVYQITILTRSLNNENFTPSKEDNRERFKADLAFQNDSKNKELDFETKTKTDESFGDRYTEEDVEKMLNNDDFKQKIIASRGKFAENQDNEDSDLIYKQGEEIDFEDEINNEDNLENEQENQNIDSESENANQENIMPQLHYELEKEKNETLTDNENE